MRSLSTLSGVLLVALAAVSCGRTEQVPQSAHPLCSPSYEPRELVDAGPLYPALSGVPGRTPDAHPAEARTTDAAAIKKIAAAACSLPVPPPDVACTLELGPGYELRFLDTRGRTTTLTAAGFGCRFVEGLETRRFNAKPLFDALAAAGLPAPQAR